MNKKLVRYLFYGLIAIATNISQSTTEQFSVRFIVFGQQTPEFFVLVSPETSAQELKKIVAQKADSFNVFKKKE